MTDISIQVHQQLEEKSIASLNQLILDAANADGAHPFSESVLMTLRHGVSDNIKHVCAHHDNQLVGYAHVDMREHNAHVEIAVSPHFRRHGVGAELLQVVDSLIEDKPLQLWAHGFNAAAALLATSQGFHQERSLWQMRRSLLSILPEPVFPAEIEVRTFNIETDLSAWIECNAHAFAHHPDQGQWTEADLRLRMQQPWFDPSGFIVAFEGEKMIGFHWTKIHAVENEQNLGIKPIGEVYVVGVVPQWQGCGLGKALTLSGLRHLRDKGLIAAMLYVDAEDATAISLYESLGFSHWDSDTLFVKNS
jgi:mycothiol synthase